MLNSENDVAYTCQLCALIVNVTQYTFVIWVVFYLYCTINTVKPYVLLVLIVTLNIKYGWLLQMEVVVNSYFCGAGLMDEGLKRAGLTIGQAFEIDKAACATYRANHGANIVETDISTELVLAQDECHGMVFTFPCNKYSAIASIHGQRTGDELYLHALRHLAVARPEFYLVENVPKMRAFKVVMEAMLSMPDYYIQVFCPVNTTIWLPQQRERLFIIATRRHFNFRPPENTKPLSLEDILEKNPVVNWPKALQNRMTGKYRDRPIISDPSKGDIAPTALAHYGRDRSTRVLADKRYPLGVRPYSVREYARLQGLDDNFVFPVTDNQAYKQIGNGVTVQAAEWFGREIVRYMNQSKYYLKKTA